MWTLSRSTGSRPTRFTSDLNRAPDYLWLKEGDHQLVLFRDGYQTLVRELTVQPGELSEVKLRMEKGESGSPQEYFAQSKRVEGES